MIIWSWKHIIKNSCWMCSHWILCYDEKNMNIWLPNLEKMLYNLKHLSDLRKIFYFSHEIETVFPKRFLWMSTEKKDLDIHLVSWRYFWVSGKWHFFFCLTFQKILKYLLPLAPHILILSVHKKLSIHWFFKSSLIVFKWLNFFK